VVTALDPNQPLTRELKACGHYKSTDGGRDVILKRTVNTYFQARAVRGAWGMSKHQGATPSEAAWGGTIHRVFLKTAHRLSKALSNLREGENLFCPRSTRLRFYRRRLWDRYTILDGVTVVG
ncbi:MAG TPA: hypothetical protein VM537_08040, partial [Anaerolineae bacterium]|nr:hypothetical protein [Anaerolineae bacterium]